MFWLPNIWTLSTRGKFLTSWVCVGDRSFLPLEKLKTLNLYFYSLPCVEDMEFIIIPQSIRSTCSAHCLVSWQGKKTNLFGSHWFHKIQKNKQWAVAAIQPWAAAAAPVSSVASFMILAAAQPPYSCLFSKLRPLAFLKILFSSSQYHFNCYIFSLSHVDLVSVPCIGIPNHYIPKCIFHLLLKSTFLWSA